ncbi:MAG: DUF4159 domain-containing protein [Gemmatimonadales bacterium]
MHDSLMARIGGLTLAIGVTSVAFHAASAQGFGRYPRYLQIPVVQNSPYDGRFTFARLSYVTGPGGYYYRGLPAWAHGYDLAERNLVQILNSLSTVHPRLDAGVVYNLDDPHLFKYPLTYMTEAGYWTLSDKEALAFRKYLLKGGFVIFDDFRNEFHGGGYENFAANMKRILPNARIVDLKPTDPIFHSFYEINSFDIIPQAYDRGKPVLQGVYEDNDPHKRLLAMINFSTDVSQYWEFSGQGYMPISQSNEAYKLGVNYLIYAMSH